MASTDQAGIKGGGYLALVFVYTVRDLAPIGTP
jgi:hypothetical protein